mmetsp:Transcript_1887/g.5009  ORF Transcript_1887/g.5009 Transcript_1887/m.5009 type:complete len:207 (+) Transcript_1887:782-1402(+)|eukprot:scaffold39939_cov30-Tisochrysis_lutea.AAC.1
MPPAPVLASPIDDEEEGAKRGVAVGERRGEVGLPPFRDEVQPRVLFDKEEAIGELAPDVLATLPAAPVVRLVDPLLKKLIKPAIGPGLSLGEWLPFAVACVELESSPGRRAGGSLLTSSISERREEAAGSPEEPERISRLADVVRVMALTTPATIPPVADGPTGFVVGLAACKADDRSAGRSEPSEGSREVSCPDGSRDAVVPEGS